MIYVAETNQERNNIHVFLDDKKNLKGYLILVVVNKEDQMLVGKQITRSKLNDVDWLLVTPTELKVLFDMYKETLDSLFVMEITMTGEKNDVFFAHNWGMLSIEHNPKTDPFDEMFAQTMNLLLDQTIYNFSKENRSHQKRIIQLLFELMMSGMFQMQPDPKRAIGE